MPQENQTSPTKCRFDKVAWFYELVSGIYSTGQISASKAWQVSQMQPEQRVLYVGVGAGEDAVLAADREVELTCVDMSQRMLHRTARKIARANHTATLLCDDIRNHRLFGHYDVVTANYFLNCFNPEDMRTMLLHLLQLLKPTGRLMIADVAPAQGNWIFRIMHELHHAVAIRSFHALGLVPLHPIYDYEPLLRNVGLQIAERAEFRLGGVGPIAYQSLICQRSQACRAAA
ncbi:MAG: class I SAM-dependent methyltransferase [Planctomycetota bacterium]|nr:class I SAM-dependent methyltransferase [Planctomycetota bacterium]